MAKTPPARFRSGIVIEAEPQRSPGLAASGRETRRLPGHFKRGSDALKFVEQLYQAGAVKVIVPDIYQSRKGDQFADNLLVQLPKAVAPRKSVRLERFHK